MKLRRQLLIIIMIIIDHNHDKYTTTPEFNKLTAENFAAK